MAQTVAKMVVLYNVPEEARADFDKRYYEEHVPLAKKMPGLRSIELFKKPRNVMGGDSPYLIAVMAFDDMASLKAAMNSPEGQAAGANIMGFAGKYLTMLTSEVEVTEGVTA